MWSKLSLPKEYDSYPVLTRLWFASRVRDPKDRGAFIQPCAKRTIVPQHFWLAVDIVYLIVPRVWAQLWDEAHAEIRPLLLAYAVHLVLQGLLPAAQLWIISRLLEMTESALNGQPANWVHALSLAIAIVVMKVGDERWQLEFNKLESRITNYIKTKTMKQYMGLRMSRRLDEPEDPVHRALIREAAIYAGDAYVQDGADTMWSFTEIKYRVNSAGQFITGLISVASQVAVTKHAISSNGFMTQLTLLVLFTLAPVAQLARWVVKPKPKDEQPSPELLIIQRTHRRMAQASRPDFLDEVLFWGLKDWLLTAWESTALEKYNLQSKLKKDDSDALQSGFGTLHNFVWVLLATQTLRTTNSLATLTLIQTTISALASRIKRIAQLSTFLIESTFHAAAFFAMIDINAEQVLREGTVDYEKCRDNRGMAIELRDLSVHYPGKEKAALSDINLIINPGETLAVVGFNGSGKTSLVMALMGLIPSTGEILINGVPSKEFSPSSLRPRMSCVQQKFARFGFTLQQEIGIGKLASIDNTAAVEKAALQGGASSVISNVGLDSPLGTLNKDYVDEKSDEMGLTENKHHPWAGLKFLSGGEWQRLALARAFMRANSADLVVFDEPTSALDPKAEAELFDSLYSLSRRDTHRATTIFISHGFGNVRRADKIAFLADGRIAECGTHEELMALEGKYYELFTLQRSGFDGERK